MSQRDQRRSGGAGPAMAFGVLFLVAGLVVAAMWVGGMRKRAQAEADAAAASATAARENASSADPFAALDEDAPAEVEYEVEEPAPVRASDGKVDPFAALGPRDAEPEEAQASKAGKAPAPGELTAAAVFQEAIRLAEKGQRLRTYATGSREEGREAEAKQQEREALANFERALSSTRAWVQNEVDPYDSNDIQVRTVRRTRERWEEHVTSLRRRLAE